MLKQQIKELLFPEPVQMEGQTRHYVTADAELNLESVIYDLEHFGDNLGRNQTCVKTLNNIADRLRKVKELVTDD